MDLNEITERVIEFLQPAAQPAGDIATKVSANAVWDWLKARFSKRSAGAAEAVESVGNSTAEPEDWEVLRLQLVKALKEDEGLRAELAALLPKPAPKPDMAQNTTQTGIGNKSAHIVGNANRVNIS